MDLRKLTLINELRETAKALAIDRRWMHTDCGHVGMDRTPFPVISTGEGGVCGRIFARGCFRCSTLIITCRLRIRFLICFYLYIICLAFLFVVLFLCSSVCLCVCLWVRLFGILRLFVRCVPIRSSVRACSPLCLPFCLLFFILLPNKSNLT